MKMRKLGKSNMAVSALGLGCMGMSMSAQRPWIVPIPGTRKLDRLDENIGAVSVELTAEDLREIDIASSRITVQSTRYPESLERLTGR